ncbi:MAG: phosphotransferase [Desulfobacterales bacterium]|nr:MAG: phosphotransferase [Desulfobacterales bacterium]
MDQNEKNLWNVIDRIQDWKGQDIIYDRVTGGITNPNWKVSVNGDAFFVKIPGKETERFIDRVNCHEANRIASETGIGPRTCYFFEDTGVEIFEWLEGYQTLKFGAVFEEEKFYKMIDLIRKFHRYTETRLPLTQTIFEQTFTMMQLAKKIRGYIPKEIDRMEWLARQIETAILTAGIAYVPCHNDVYTNNYVWNDQKQDMRLLDFEYASMNDAFYDLAAWATTNYFTEAMDKELIRYYCGEYDEKNYARFKLYKIQSEIKWAMWSCVQAVNSTIKDFDFHNWLGAKMARLRYFWSDPRLDYWLDLLKGVPIF